MQLSCLDPAGALAAAPAIPAAQAAVVQRADLATSTHSLLAMVLRRRGAGSIAEVTA